MPKRAEPYEKLLISFPQSVVSDLVKYARLTGQSKSAFVTAAAKAYIKPMADKRRKAQQLLKDKGLTDAEIKRVLKLLD